jgi:hypothetical protein
MPFWAAFLLMWAAPNAARAQEAGASPRALPAPYDSIFPQTEYLGPTIGVSSSAPNSPLNDFLWRHSDWLQSHQISISGWADVGYNASSSKRSNQPMSYDIVPNSVQLDQAVLQVMRAPDTVQTDHFDWGFNFTGLYGMDYRYTTAQGYFSQQLLEENKLYGFDPLIANAQLYLPAVGEGSIVTIGRYISPADIEAQTAPSNLLYTHSLMFTFDEYTQTGVTIQTKLNDHWSTLLGVNAGGDIAPWAPAAQPTGQALLRWVSPDDDNSLWGGATSFNNGKFTANHDNLQEFNMTWSHRFTRDFFTETEGYYMDQWDAVLGGTCNFGPVTAFGGGGCGAPLPGMSREWGAVNYTEYKLGSKDFLSVRNDWLDDVDGERTGFATQYASWTVGVTHDLTALTEIRPELRYERAFNGPTPYDDGTRRDQYTFSVDIIQFF